MRDFFVFGATITIATMAVLDVIRYSPLFDEMTKKSEELARSQSSLSLLGYLFLCNHCLSHWIAGVFLLGGFWCANSIIGNVSPYEGLLLFFITARLATMLHENLLRPLPPWLGEPDNETARRVLSETNEPDKTENESSDRTQPFDRGEISTRV